MSEQVSDQAPVTFLDVAAYFSEEEWKLLHHWQKELYRNVMKEIHQALISLGPLIATSIFSLRPKEREDMCLMDFQDSEIRGSIFSSPRDMAAESDGLFRKTSKANQNLKDTHVTDPRESHDGPSTGHQILKSDDVLRTKQELESSLIDRYGAGGGESSTGTSLGFPFHNTEIEEHLSDCYGMERQRSICLNSGPDVAPIGINEKGETYPIVIQDYRKRESINGLAEATKRRSKDGYSVTPIEGKKPHKDSSEKAKVKEIQKSEEPTNSESQLWSKSNQNLGGEKATRCEIGLGNERNSSLHQLMSKVGRSDKDECDSKLGNVNDFLGQANIHQSCEPHTFPECEKSFSQNFSFIKNQRKPTELSHKESYFQCTECDKSFSQKRYLICHQKIHSVDKPYHCTECEKSFNYKHHLIGHQRTHSGERPFQCTQCAKSFTWKDSLQKHQRTHMGDV